MPTEILHGLKRDDNTSSAACLWVGKCEKKQQQKKKKLSLFCQAAYLFRGVSKHVHRFTMQVLLCTSSNDSLYWVKQRDGWWLKPTDYSQADACKNGKHHSLLICNNVYSTCGGQGRLLVREWMSNTWTQSWQLHRSKSNTAVYSRLCLKN